VGFGGAGGRTNSGPGAGGTGGLSVPKATHNGRLVCFAYNQVAGCGRARASVDACKDARGGIYAHYCNFYFKNTQSHCLMPHPRCSNHWGLRIVMQQRSTATIAGH